MMISVIIPVFNRQNLLNKCLRSLWNQKRSIDYEVIVADDGSSEDIEKVVKKFKIGGFSNLVYIRNKFNKGPAYTRNTGLRIARGEIIGFVDSDMTVASDWLYQGFISFNDVLVGGIEGKTIVTEKEKITPFTHQTENLYGKEYITANIFYRSRVIKEVGGFDEKFTKPFREDSDLAFRVLDAGYMIPFNPFVKAYHPPLPASFLMPLKLASLYYFDPLLFRKHPIRYKRELAINRFGPFTVRRIFQKITIFSTLFLLLVILTYFLKSNIFFNFFVICYCVSSLFVWLYLLRGKASLKNSINAIPFVIIIPLVACFKIIKGCIQFKAFPPYWYKKEN